MGGPCDGIFEQPFRGGQYAMSIAKVVALLGLGLALLAPTAALAQRGDDWYRDIGPWLGRAGEEGTRKARLIEEYSRLRGEVRREDRRGAISPREADRLYGRLDKVARFLRNDRHLTNSEYNRRRDDLDSIARDLERATGTRTGRGDRGRRRDW
jgi:hypothetical protein